MVTEVIEAMREASKIAANALQEAGKAVAPGVTTDDFIQRNTAGLRKASLYPRCAPSAVRNPGAGGTSKLRNPALLQAAASSPPGQPQKGWSPEL